MAIDLMALEPQKISKDLKGKYILLYGEEKVGKTTIASKFPKVLIAAFEMGSNALNDIFVQPVKTWSDWKSMVRQLTKTKALQDKFDTIALDVVDIAYDACTKYICDENNVESLGEIPYGAGYQMVDKEFESTLRELMFGGYGLLFISHENEKTLKNDKGEEYTKIVPSMSKRCSKIVNGMVDVIGYLRNINLRDENGKSVTERYIYLKGDDRFLAGSRFQPIEARIPMTYTGLVDAIYDAIDKTAERDGTEITNEVNPFAKRSFSELMSEAKSLWNDAAKADKKTDVLAVLERVFEKPTKFSDIKEEDIDKLEEAIGQIEDVLN